MVLNVSPFGPVKAVPRMIEGTGSLYSERADKVFAFSLLMLIYRLERGSGDMANVQMLDIQEVGGDYLLLRRGGMGVRVNFANSKQHSKEDCAAFFRGMEGKDAAIPADFNEPFFIALDFWRSPDNSCRVIPFTFAVSTIDLLAGDANRTVALCPIHRIQMRETDEWDVPGVLFFYCPHPAGCDRRFSKESGHITIGDLPCRSSGSAHLI